MFQFAFKTFADEGPENGSEPTSVIKAGEQTQSPESQTRLKECEEIELTDELRKEVTINPDNMHVFLASGDIQVEYINCLSLPKEELSEDIQSAEYDHSDLIPGKYEGGLKVWECTFDLGELMTEKEEHKQLFSKSTVLDLGCGSGILGLLAVKLGAEKVVFQDYNEDVLRNVTLKNYSFNCCGSEAEADENCSSRAVVQFFSGDWTSFGEKVNDLYDIILSSETIYNTGSYEKLLNLFKSKLKPDGVVLLAAKTYYFGVGGGLRVFEKALDEDGQLSYRTAWECDSGVKREILEIRRKPPTEK